MLKDLRQSARGLLRAPGYATVAVLTLALGIGASTAIYTLLERIVLDPLPYPESDRLVRLKSAVPGVGEGAEWNLATAEYFHFAQATTLDAIGVYQRQSGPVQTPAGPRMARLAVVGPDLLPMIGARTALGRMLEPADASPGAAEVVMLSHGFWQLQFGGDPDVVGSTITVADRPMTVVGVMAAGVELPGEPGGGMIEPPELWVAMPLNPAGPFFNSHVVPAVARLAPGATLEAAAAELDRLTSQLAAAYPQVYSPRFMEEYGFRTVAYPLKSYIVGDVASNLWMVLGAVGLVLLIACANVANLFLVRIEGRRRELAVRAALGASRTAIARHFLSESLVLAGAAGGLAVLLGVWLLDWLLTLAPPTFPRLEAMAVDGSVLAFTFALTLFVALALAAFPLLRHVRTQASELAEGGRSSTVGRERQRVRGGLVVTQVALALVLLVGAGLLLESFRRLRAVEPGIDPEGVITMQVSLPSTRYADVPAMWGFYRAVLERVRALPGVTGAAFGNDLPFAGGFGCTIQGFEDPEVRQRAEETLCAGQEPTSPGYFEAMGIPLLAGRTFTNADNDNPATGAVIVSRAFAERFWPGQDPIGKGVAPNGRHEGPFYRVVGVVGDVYSSSLQEPPAIAIYYPIQRIPDSGGWTPASLNLVVKTSAVDPAPVFAGIRSAVAEVDPTIPLANAYTMDELLGWSMSRLSFTMVLLAVAAAIALLLAAIGLYGVVSYLVTRRTNEIGIRIALGADPGRVERMVVGGSFRLTLAGLVLGMLAALALTRVMQSLLFEVRPTHPVAYALAGVVLTTVALGASWLPARRAARVDPMTALRNE